MKKYILFCLTIVFFIGCGGSSDIDVKNAVLTIPDLIAGGTSSSRATDAELKADLNTVYSPVTDVFNKFANEALVGTNSLLEKAQTFLFDDSGRLAGLKLAGSFSYVDSSTNTAWTLTYADGVYGFVATDNSGTEDTADDRKYLNFSLTPKSSGYSGTIYYTDYDASETTTPVVKVVFDTTDETYGHVTELTVINMKGYASTADEISQSPEKLWLKFSYKDSKYSGAATALYKDYNGAVVGSDFDEFFVDFLAQSDSATSGSGCYSYRTIVTETTSGETTTYKAALDLALVPFSSASTTPFTTWSVSEAYKDVIARYLKYGTDGAGPSTNNIDEFNDMITDYNTAIAGPYSGQGYSAISGAITTGTTTADIFTIINTLNTFVTTESITGYDFLNAFAFVTKLTNPGYYDSTSIFLGTNDLDTPSWSSDFDTSTIPFSPKTPAEMDALTVTMP
ncbi:MAG: hypothetical protein JXR63_00915 [Spirochaetales bacterium]|nr:hypothetical protein [Spirochaetales bacterium]